MLVRSAALLVVLCLVASGCSKSREDPDDPLGKALLESAGTGFERVDGPSGPMDLEATSSALGYVRSTELRRQLGRTGFQQGYARVWRNDSDAFVTALVLDFVSERRAAEMVAFATERLKALPGAFAFPVTDIPGAQGFILNGERRTGSDALFCQLVWFPRGTRAHEVRRCGEQPAVATTVLTLARKQGRLAG